MLILLLLLRGKRRDSEEARRTHARVPGCHEDACKMREECRWRWGRRVRKERPKEIGG